MEHELTFNYLKSRSKLIEQINTEVFIVNKNSWNGIVVNRILSLMTLHENQLIKRVK